MAAIPHFKDTERREKELKEAGLFMIGSGTSGGEKGALLGPSLMPGGDRAAYEQIRPIWESIAAKVPDGPCVTYIGPGGSGHFVKMVHNGIEYGDMQLIAEAYGVMRYGFGASVEELADIFDEWNRGDLESYLIEITAKILRVKDETTGKPLVDLVLDKAGQKGTGKWTSQIALDLGVAIPTIDAAIVARTLSSQKDIRVEASKKIKGIANGDVRELTAGDRSEYSRCTLRVKNLFLCAGNESDQGRLGGVWLEHQSQRSRAHLAGRLHYSRQVSGRDNACISARREFDESAS